MYSHTQLIGIDFDNTIACYDDLLFRLAVERDLIPANFRKGKQAIRDHVRLLPDGELKWQRLQAVMYGPAIDGAQPFDGVLNFMRGCRVRGVSIHIISHKTAYSNLMGDGVNFRDAATRWLRQHGFFDSTGAGLSPIRVWYESTRQQKVARVRSLGCTDFIDDLQETFLEKEFPLHVNKVFFNPHGETVQADDVRNCSHWSEIEDVIFHDCSSRN